MGRQYIGEIGKTENGIVVVTTHLYDRSKSLPLDIELYQHSSCLPEGKKDTEFKKKPELALDLIDRSLAFLEGTSRKLCCERLEKEYRPGIVLVDAGYGNNTTFLIELEKRRLKYLGGLAKNRKVIINKEPHCQAEIRLDNLARITVRGSFHSASTHSRKTENCVGGNIGSRAITTGREENNCYRHECSQ